MNGAEEEEEGAASEEATFMQIYIFLVGGRG